MAYRIVPFPVQVFSNGILSYGCAADDKISNDVAYRAVPLRQLSFLCCLAVLIELRLVTDT